MAAIIRGALAAANPIVLAKAGAWEAMVVNHGRVVEVIERRDAAAAEAASLALIDYTAEEIGSVFAVERPVHG
jgi:DNA-binding FadR family transcriptional regulator